MAESNFELINIITNYHLFVYILILILNASIVCNIITDFDWVRGLKNIYIYMYIIYIYLYILYRSCLVATILHME